MSESDNSFAADLVGDIWENLELRLKPFNLGAEVEMHLLGVFQHSIEVFGLTREEVGIPSEDADAIFAKRVSASG